MSATSGPSAVTPDGAPPALHAQPDEPPVAPGPLPAPPAEGAGPEHAGHVDWQLVSATNAAFAAQLSPGVLRQAAQVASRVHAEASPQHELVMHDAQSGRGSVTPPHAGPLGFVGIVGIVGMTGVGFVVPPPAAWQVGFDAQTVMQPLPHWHCTMAV